VRHEHGWPARFLIGDIAVYFSDMAKTSAETRAAVGIKVE
jgi:hypothetical protein